MRKPRHVLRTYGVTWRRPSGDTRSLGRVTARHAWAAATVAYQRWPFLPMGSLSLHGESEGPEPRRRGFEIPAVQEDVRIKAHTPEAREKRAVSRAMTEARKPPAKPLTKGQRFWRDNMRRRKHISPHPRTDGG